ncbi:MAG: RagB/SusD family nutrient uptake outer membrane protein [Gemmatimonadota bacterium]|nr:RagB/SusD family nutrient uptake outer membrane protein [Gemmatimonadota bacterium]
MKSHLRKAGFLTLLALAPIAACTDLTEVPSSSISPENFYANEAEVLGGLASVYAQLRTTTDEYYNVSEVSSDEIIVPTRGTDWYDNGKWLDLDRQTFGPNSPGGLDNINGAWTELFRGVARANVVLAAIEGSTFASTPVVQAELRTLRAFYYYLLQDLFGGVPIVTDLEIAARPRNTRAEVFAFIESELNAARAVLPVSWPANMNGRVTRGAADALLASLYLNAEVFTGTVTAAGLQRGAPRWQDAITAADRVINSGQYTLASNWRSNFTATNHTSPEIIFAVKFAAVDGLGLNFVMRALHYTQYDSPTPWNGFATIAETYAQFDPDDTRRQIFLEGRQFNLVTGAPVNDRAGNPLIFDPAIPDPTQAGEGAGVRIVKWPVDPAHVAQNNGNDYAHFRLAEVILIKAEALNELGGAGTAQAVTLINSIRARNFATPEPVTATTQAAVRTAIMQERLYELTAEAKRRTDLIRFGRWQATWFNKTATEPYKVLMPIPSIQIGTNPELAQNPGY